jgi:hypothetical protein
MLYLLSEMVLYHFALQALHNSGTLNGHLNLYSDAVVRT